MDFDLATQPQVEVPFCPVCGTANAAVNQTDRYGFAIRVSTCTECGLAYLNPRMTAEGYAAFYAGPYRALIHKKFPWMPQPPLDHQRQTGANLGEWAKGKIPADVDLLDAGGSTGVTAQAFCQCVPMASVTILDPSLEELAHAQGLGYQTVQGTIEDAPLGDRQYGAILCNQTIDHVLDPLKALSTLRAHLAPGGRMWVDMVDYQRWNKQDWPKVTFKLDHPLNWTKQAFQQALRQTGWRIVAACWYHLNRRYGVVVEGR